MELYIVMIEKHKLIELDRVYSNEKEAIDRVNTLNKLFDSIENAETNAYFLRREVKI